MGNIQVLVATMGRSDFSIAEKMNIPCDAILANQTDETCYSRIEKDGHNWQMISTNTRGVGTNRNLALLASDADIVLFADDDIVYYDGLQDGVLNAFDHWPDADVMLFSIEYEKEARIFRRKQVPQKRMRVFNSLKYGTCVVAAKRESLLRENITFHRCFGGGCLYGCGEDTLFLKECFDKKLKVYSYDYVLGVCNKDGSTWFEGFNEKFFYDKGAMLSIAFPKLKFLMLPLFAAKFRESNLPYWKRLQLMRWGGKNVKGLIPYSQEKSKKFAGKV